MPHTLFLSVVQNIGNMIISPAVPPLAQTRGCFRSILGSARLHIDSVALSDMISFG